MMQRKWWMVLLLVGITATVQGQLYDYSVVGQHTNDRWDGKGDSEFNIQTVSTGFQVGQMVEEGFGTEWAGTVLIPLSLTFDGEDDSQTSTIEDANFGFGLGFRFGIGYGLNPTERLVVTPGLAYHGMYIRYSFDFPGGASEYYELTHGPAAVGQAAFQVTPQFWVQGGMMFAFSPFHSGGASQSGPDEDMLYGLVTRGWVGIRTTAKLPRRMF